MSTHKISIPEILEALGAPENVIHYTKIVCGINEKDSQEVIFDDLDRVFPSNKIWWAKARELTQTPAKKAKP